MATDAATKRRLRIFFVNRFYWPDESATSQLLSDLAEHLAKNGADVTVITSRLRYTSSEGGLESKEHHKGVQIYRVWTTAFDRSSLAGRVLDFLTFYLSATLALVFLSRAQDLIIAKTDPPFIQVFAGFASLVRRAQLINWCQDLFPEVAYALKRRAGNTAMRSVLHQARNFVLRRSSMNVAISDEMRRTLVSQGINRDRVIVIRNWCSQAITPVPREANALRREWQLESNIVLGYSGNLGRAHVPEKVFALVQELADIETLKFLFIGSGHGMSWLMERCRAKRYDHVVFKPYQPRERLSLSLSVPDLHLISLNRECQKYIAPSKFYGILAAGRPIVFLGNKGCDLAREIDQSRLGITLGIDAKEEWRSTLLSALDQEAELVAMGRNARQTFETRFQPEVSLDAWQQTIRNANPTGEARPDLISALR
jgi:glycosyltransferase involved in cell wall biosynthesis